MTESGRGGGGKALEKGQRKKDGSRENGFSGEATKKLLR